MRGGREREGGRMFCESKKLGNLFEVFTYLSLEDSPVFR